MKHVDVSGLRKTIQAEILEEDQDEEKEVKSMTEVIAYVPEEDTASKQELRLQFGYRVCGSIFLSTPGVGNGRTFVIMKKDSIK